MLAISASFVPGLFASQMFSWSSTASGYSLDGNVTFSTEQDGSAFDLVIQVNNSAPVGPSKSSEILTGLYFDITGVSQTTLAMMSGIATDGFIESGNYTEAAAGTAGSNVCAPGAGGTAPNPTCSTTVPGGWETGYWSSGKDGYNYGIGTSGLSGAFDGNTNSGAGQVDYGILPTAASPSPALVDPNSGVTNEFPYIDGTATFVLSGLTSSQITISSVAAEYGTTPDHSVTASQAANNSQAGSAPEPAAIFEVSGGLILFFAARCGFTRAKR